ncbi:MAG: hypothetical protein HQL51_06270 [Magnetococcales bacterium]|nr:hypothetical protein [Magnetococcales bacterium]
MKSWNGLKRWGGWLAAAITAVGLGLPPASALASGGVAPPKQDWTFSGVFGRFDEASLKRGAQVAVEVCMSCHSIKYIKFDHLRSFGFSEAEVKAMAESQGKTKKDKMISGMDPQAAKDSFGTIPPDLSLMTKARKGYEDYTYGILTGYLNDKEKEMVEKIFADGNVLDPEIKEAAEALHLGHDLEKAKKSLERIHRGDNFNKYFPGNFLAMPQPISAGQVTFADGKESSLEQMAKDVTSFLAWAAEPTAMERKSAGVKVIAYLVLLTIMLYAVKRRVWSRIPH